MAAPSWLAGTFAVLMILTAAYSVSRLAASPLRGRVTEWDADGLHAVMGAAMAGMLVPRLHLLPDRVWAVVFGIAGVWFGWHALRARAVGSAGISRCRYPVPHLVECAAMIYMLLPVHRPPHGGTGMAMPGMSAVAGSPGFPALAVVLALFLLGYIVWTTDRLTSQPGPGATTAEPGQTRDNRSPVTVKAVARTHDRATAASAPAAGPQPGDQAGRLALAPRLAAFSKIAMSITMGYMLILML